MQNRGTFPLSEKMKVNFQNIILIKTYVPHTRKRKLAQHSFSLLWVDHSLVEEETGAVAQAVELVTFQACLSACPLKSKGTLKGLGQAPTQPEALPTWHGELSLAFMVLHMALAFVPQRRHPNFKRCLKTQKITYGGETTLLTGSSALLLCVELGCIWLKVGALLDHEENRQ